MKSFWITSSSQLVHVQDVPTELLFALMDRSDISVSTRYITLCRHVYVYRHTRHRPLFWRVYRRFDGINEAVESKWNRSPKGKVHMYSQTLKMDKVILENTVFFTILWWELSPLRTLVKPSIILKKHGMEHPLVKKTIFCWQRSCSFHSPDSIKNVIFHTRISIISSLFYTLAKMTS